MDWCPVRNVNLFWFCRVGWTEIWELWWKAAFSCIIRSLISVYGRTQTRSWRSGRPKAGLFNHPDKEEDQDISD